MKFPALRLAAALLVATPAFAGCSVYQAYAQRQAIEQAKFSLKSVAFTGVDLSGANVEVTLELANPTEIPIVLDRLDYTLFVNDQRAVSGFTRDRVNVPAGDVRPITFATHLRFADIGNQLNAIRQRGVASYRLEGIGHFDTPVGTIDYPVKLFERR